MRHIIKKILLEDDFDWIQDSKPVYKPLRFEERHIYYVDYGSLQQLIREVFRGGFGIENYSIPHDLESSNDVIHEVEPILDDEEHFMKWYTGNERYTKWSATPRLGQFMCAMVEMDIIPNGDWMVDVSW